MSYNREYGENAFKPIKENQIILDFTGVKDWWKIHEILKEKFGLPDYYGKNWSALWDCLDGLFLDDGEVVVKIYGFNSFDEELREYCNKMLEVFDRVHKETPNIIFELLS